MFEPKYPIFSIIIPIYQVESYLHQCVDSVLAQSFPHYEVILVNDGSPDNCGKICDEYAKHPKVRVIHKENGGLSSARNHGMAVARGEYLVFLDSDDYWEGEVLSSLWKMIHLNRPDIILCGHTSISPNKIQPNPKSRWVEQGNFVQDFSQLHKQGDFDTTGWNKVVKRELVQTYGLTFPIGRFHEDCAWSFDLALYAETYAIFPTTFYQYRIARQGSITAQIRPKHVQDLLAICQEKLALWHTLPDGERKDALKWYLSQLCHETLCRVFLLERRDIKALRPSIKKLDDPSIPSVWNSPFKRVGIKLFGKYRFYLFVRSFKKIKKSIKG